MTESPRDHPNQYQEPMQPWPELATHARQIHLPTSELSLYLYDAGSADAPLLRLIHPAVAYRATQVAVHHGQHPVIPHVLSQLLIEQVMQAARRTDVSLVGIDFWSFNHAARACFEKAGFKVNKEFMSLVL